jgi:hypothetical protein
MRAAYQCRKIRPYIGRGQFARPDCLHDLPGLCGRAGMRIDEQFGAQDGFGIRLAHLRCERTDKVDMLPGLQPLTLQQRFSRQRWQLMMFAANCILELSTAATSEAASRISSASALAALARRPHRSTREIGRTIA